MQITLTLDLTAENLDKLKVFCQETGAAPAQTGKKAAAKTETAKTEAAKTEAVKEEPTSEPEKKTEEKKAYTLTDVRAVALKLSKAGKSDTLKEIFAKFDATKLSEVPEDKYADLMEELANA